MGERSARIGSWVFTGGIFSFLMVYMNPALRKYVPAAQLSFLDTLSTATGISTYWWATFFISAIISLAAGTMLYLALTKQLTQFI